MMKSWEERIYAYGIICFLYVFYSVCSDLCSMSYAR